MPRSDPEVQVGVTDDGGSGPTRAVQTAGAYRGQALDEFDLTHRTHLLWSVGAIHGAGLNIEHRLILPVVMRHEGMSTLLCHNTVGHAFY